MQNFSPVSVAWVSAGCPKVRQSGVRSQVTLDSLERKDLETLTRSREVDSKPFRNYRFLVLYDRSPHEPRWIVLAAAAAATFGVTEGSFVDLKRRVVADGLDSTPQYRPAQYPVTFDGVFAARLLALGMLLAPKGHTRSWAGRLQ